MVQIAFVSNVSLGLAATVTVSDITAGPNEGCVLLSVTNNSTISLPNNQRFIGAICLNMNRTGPFFVDGDEVGGGNCPGGFKLP